MDIRLAALGLALAVVFDTAHSFAAPDARLKPVDDSREERDARTGGTR